MQPIKILTVCMAAGCVPGFAPGASYRDVVMLDSPIAYYRLAEAPGTATAADETGAHHGVYRNDPARAVPGAIITDPTNHAVSFASTADQYVELTTLGDFGSGMPNGYTLEYWARIPDGSRYQAVMGSANPDYTTNLLVDVAAHDPGELRVYCRDDDWNRFEARHYPTGYNIDIYDGEWHHLAHVFDPGGVEPTDRVIYYVDSLRQDLDIRRREVPLTASDFVYPFTLAAWNGRGTVSSFLEGSLDEVAVYARPLSAVQVAEHYHAAVPEPSTLVLSAMAAVGLLGCAWRRRRRAA